MPLSSIAEHLDSTLPRLDLCDRLRLLCEAAAGGRAILTTSFGLEDQILTHALCELDLDVELATLDTGRLFPETYALWARTEARYGRRVRAFYPEATALEALVADQGADGFYGSVEMRKACCAVRKVAPLGRALAGAAVWIAGLRADQSEERRAASFASFDLERGLIKANPLLDWSRRRALAYARERDVPLNPLHERGFLSIGCAPCTRAVGPDEDERAGRWWWERSSARECGLHVDSAGGFARARTGAAS